MPEVAIRFNAVQVGSADPSAASRGLKAGTMVNAEAEFNVFFRPSSRASSAPWR